MELDKRRKVVIWQCERNVNNNITICTIIPDFPLYQLSVNVKFPTAQFLNGSNNKTGAIVAVGAGRNKTGARSRNNATQIKRQIGSTAKPMYDYGPAIEYNNWNPSTLILDEKQEQSFADI